VPIAELLYPGCRDCPVHNPRFADHLLADPVPQSPRPEFDPEVETVEAETPDRRWERFRREMGRCILCFACRQLCPACYCTECFAESSQPKWMGRTDDPADAMFFHLTRLLHLAGRCTGCGACVRGCPMEVNLRLYNDKLRKDAKATFRFEAGMDPAAPPPLVCYHAEDPNEFVR
jgi:ferredoxin